mmetsp:Transcript_41373/g.67114  ORF Transcript_41373/g.67114 Transcript_41373/m.67114 type:complete len:92 (-) Transcript_41373:232-507(-)
MVVGRMLQRPEMGVMGPALKWMHSIDCTRNPTFPPGALRSTNGADEDLKSKHVFYRSAPSPKKAKAIVSSNQVVQTTWQCLERPLTYHSLR